jgi:hypothetical protein
MTNNLTDRAARPDMVARTLAQAALQATARALHTAQMALDAMERSGNEPAELQAAMADLRDGLADAYAAMPDKVRQEVLRAPGTIGGDELLDLLATLVRAREGRTGHGVPCHNNNTGHGVP